MCGQPAAALGLGMTISPNLRTADPTPPASEHQQGGKNREAMAQSGDCLPGPTETVSTAGAGTAGSSPAAEGDPMAHNTQAGNWSPGCWPKARAPLTAIWRKTQLVASIQSLSPKALLHRARAASVL